MTKYSAPTVLTRIRWTALRICRQLRGHFSRNWTRMTSKRWMTLPASSEIPITDKQWSHYSDHSEMLASSESSSGGSSPRPSPSSSPQPLLESESVTSTVGSSVVKTHISNSIIGAFVIVVSGILGYWAQDRDDPIVNYRAEIVTPKVEQGGVLKVRHTFDRKRECHVILEQLTYDAEGVRTAHANEDYAVAPGGVGPERFITALKLPITATVGEARYRAIRAYHCNPLQKLLDLPIVVLSPDLTYTVVGRDPGTPVIEVVPVPR